MPSVFRPCFPCARKAFALMHRQKTPQRIPFPLAFSGWPRICSALYKTILHALSYRQSLAFRVRGHHVYSHRNWRWAIRDVLQRFHFADHGMDVTGTCESAVQAILPRTPDIILSDACIARCCQAHCPFSRIILVSGYARFSYVCEALPAGVFKSIRRPLADSRSANGWDRHWQSLRLACIRMTDRTSHALHRCTFHPFSAPGQGRRCTVCASLLSAGDLLPTHWHDLYPVQADAARQQAQGNITPSCGFDRSSTPSRVFSQ